MPVEGKTGLALFAIVVILAAGAIGIGLHFGLKQDPKPTRGSALVNCYPEGGADEGKCKDRGCSWKEFADDKAPKCVYPESGGYGYKADGAVENTPLGFRIRLQRIERPSMYGEDLETILLSVEYHDESRLRIKFSAVNESSRWQVPIDIEAPPSRPNENETQYVVDYTNEPQFGITVRRRSTGKLVFDTRLPGFTFSDQFLQLTTRLPSAHVYGLGEHNHKQFKHNTTWRTWTIFTRDVAPVDDWGLYGAHPFFMNLENTGEATGIFLKNSNAMDIALQPEPHPAVSFRVIGGVLDFYLFLGPTPENVVQQFSKAVGLPPMPPYWSLGFQMSRWGYDNQSHVERVVERVRAAGIPYDAQYIDIEYMVNRMDFTIDKVNFPRLKEFVEDLYAHGQKYIVILDPAISSNRTMHAERLGEAYGPLEDGIEKNVFIKTSDGSRDLEGEVWPGLTYYPDFTHPNATAYWEKWCRDFYYKQGIRYDALWIDMNEPSSFIAGSTDGCEKNSFNNPPFVPNILNKGSDGRMYDKTICMDAQQYSGRHYDLHSLYGHSMSKVTYNVLRNMFPEKRPLVLSRSTFSGTGHYAVHWLGDNQSQWRQMPWSIVGMLEFGLFGIPFNGADICGFWYAATEEMCQRWHQLGAFYPFSRNHNAETWPDQDPAAFGEAFARNVREVMMTRYKLLPYLYTLFHFAHTEGGTVARSLMAEFTRDSSTWAIDRQFLWGSALMITPVMEKGQTEVSAYFPAGRWYDYYTGKEVSFTGKSRTHILPTPIEKINLHVRGGHVIPWQEPANTTVYSRKKPMGLTVALGDLPDLLAEGSLFWDDGESYETFASGKYTMIDFKSRGNKLDLTVRHSGYPDADKLIFSTIELWGLDTLPSYFTLDGARLPHSNIRYNGFSKAVQLINLDLNITQPHSVEWTIF